MRIALLLVVAALGCDTAVSPPSGPLADAMVSQSCLDAVEHSDLAWLQDEVLTPQCASFNACHKGMAASAGDLNLEEGQTQGNTVGVASGLFPEYELVTPGDSTASYMWIIMGGAESPIDPQVGTMPLRSPLVCRGKLDALARWIDSLEPTE